MDGVESLEALSDIINSKSVKVCESMESRHLRMNFSPLNTGKPMLILGF